MTNWVKAVLHVGVITLMVAWIVVDRSAYSEGWHAVVIPICVQVLLSTCIELTSASWHDGPDGPTSIRTNPDQLLQWEQLQTAWVELEANRLPGDPPLDARQAFDELNLSPARRIAIITALFHSEELPTDVNGWVQALQEFENEAAQQRKPCSVFLAKELAQFSKELNRQRLPLMPVRLSPLEQRLEAVNREVAEYVWHWLWVMVVGAFIARWTIQSVQLVAPTIWLLIAAGYHGWRVFRLAGVTPTIGSGLLLILGGSLLVTLMVTGVADLVIGTSYHHQTITPVLIMIGVLLEASGIALLAHWKHQQETY